MSIQRILKHTLLLDLETTKSGKIRQIGAVFNDHRFEKTKLAGSKAVLYFGDVQTLGTDFGDVH